MKSRRYQAKRRLATRRRPASLIEALGEGDLARNKKHLRGYVR